MYSYEDRIREIKLYVKYDPCAADTIRGYDIQVIRYHCCGTESSGKQPLPWMVFGHG